MPKKKATTKEEQAEIIRLHLQGLSPNKISEITHIRFPRVKTTIQEFQQTGQVPEGVQTGRPPIPNTALTIITALTVQNRMTSCYYISKMLFDQNILISPTTVWRKRKELGFNYKPPKIRQALNEQQIENRLKFAYSVLNSPLDYTRLVFSDESRFCLGSDNQWRWYRRGDDDDQVFAEVEKFSSSIMVYGAIGLDYKSKLVICEKTLDALEYRNVINKSQMKNDLDEKYGEGQYIFMQDGAPAHTSYLTSLFLQKRVSYLKIWPANSPDLNPIEHLWGAMKRIIKTKNITSKNELIETVQEVWDAFPQESIDSLVESFATRLRMVVAVGGESISDILRNGLQFDVDYIQIHPQAIKPLFHFIRRYDPTINDTTPEVLSKRSWTPEEVELLIQQVRILGNKWTVIARRFRDRTPGSLKAKYQALLRQ